DACATQSRGRVAEERVDDECRLSRAGDAADTGEESERDVCGDVAQVVAAGTDDADLARGIRAQAQRRELDAASAGQVLSGDGSRFCFDVPRVALRHQVPAVRTGARA